MNRKLLIVAIILTLAVAALPVGTAEGAPDSSNYYVEGTVVKGNSEGNTPMPDVVVTIIENNIIRNSAVTDADGYFKIGIKANTDLQISFTAPEFTIRSCPNTTRQAGTDVLILDLKNVALNLSTKTYTITSGADGMQPAMMIASIGELRGTVTYTGGAVENAHITLISVNDGNTKYNAFTNDRGQFTITCPVGTYYVQVTCNGFVGSGTMTATVSSNTSSLSVTLIKENVNKYFGLDAAHVLMLVAVLIGILLVATAWILSRRMMNRSTDTDIVDDRPEDDDIRYP